MQKGFSVYFVKTNIHMIKIRESGADKVTEIQPSRELTDPFPEPPQ